eukprot:221107-Prymnesium_polylepis.2
MLDASLDGGCQLCVKAKSAQQGLEADIERLRIATFRRVCCHLETRPLWGVGTVEGFAEAQVTQDVHHEHLVEKEGRRAIGDAGFAGAHCDQRKAETIVTQARGVQVGHVDDRSHTHDGWHQIA